MSTPAPPPTTPQEQDGGVMPAATTINLESAVRARLARDALAILEQAERVLVNGVELSFAGRERLMAVLADLWLRSDE